MKLSNMQKRALSMRRRILALTMVFVVGFLSVMVYRVDTYSRSLSVKGNDGAFDGSRSLTSLKDLVNGERNKISGDIYDRAGLIIAKGKDINGLMEVADVHLDPLLGVPVGNNKNYFYLRTAMGQDLYGVGAPLQSLLSSNPLKLRARGQDVTLTIDSKLNAEIYQLFERSEVDKGAALVYNYQTGEVVASVSYPDFNTSGERYKKLLGKDGLVSENKKKGAAVNNCTQEVHIPASTIKPVLYAAAFSMHPELTDFECYCPGYWQKGEGKTITDRGHEHVDLNKATACSCNIYPEKLSELVSAEEFTRYFQETMGLDKKIHKTWEGLNYYGCQINMSDRNQMTMSMIGEGNTSSSPLMLARIYGAILNKGIMVTPGYSKAKEDAEQEPESKRIFKKAACKAVLAGMGAAVTEDYGTCHILSELDLGQGRIYSKSGTGDDKNNTSWVVSGVKKTQKPYIILTGVFQCTKGSANQNAKELNKGILEAAYQ